MGSTQIAECKRSLTSHKHKYNLNNKLTCYVQFTHAGSPAMTLFTGLVKAMGARWKIELSIGIESYFTEFSHVFASKPEEIQDVD